MYTRSLKSRLCRSCEQVEASLLGWLETQHAERWARCGGQDHVMFSLRCPTPNGYEMANKGYRNKLFNLWSEPLRGIHLCYEPEPSSRARAPTQSSVRFHSIAVPPMVDFKPMVEYNYAARTGNKSKLLFFQGGARLPLLIIIIIISIIYSAQVLSSSSVHNDVTLASESAVPAGTSICACALKAHH
ncbi:hypothetical protein T492DRAFT_16040 [Pavlovales sp. CCMP2436]|nr:hypothetical protein T492DRAFT_16040 [Pavlovales sp. CCMP2436]